MRITDLRVFWTSGEHCNWTFVKLYTDSGLTGIGEATIERNDEVVLKALESFRDFLIEQDPFQIEFIINALYKQTFKYGQLIILTALSGVEQALWNIKGKALEVPIYEFLGGKIRDRLRAYANAWAFVGLPTTVTEKDTPDSIARNARKMVDCGFTAMKWDPFRDGGQAISREEEAYALASVQAVREAVGPGVELLIECHGRFNMLSATRLARKLEPYDPFVYEEPIPPDNIDALAALRQAINLPIATGERLYTRWDFRPLFEKNAAQLIQPDVCNVGGILELKKIAAMAEAYYVAVQPHNSNGPVQTLASMHVDATIPNFLFQELFYPYLDHYNEILTEPIVYRDGYLELPSGPGLGSDIREDYLLKHPGVPRPRMATWIGSYW